MFQDFRYSDTTHLSRSVKVLKLKNFKKDATLKLFKNGQGTYSNQEVNDHYNIFTRERQEYELKTKDKAYHTLETTHVEFFSDEDEPEVDLGNIINSYIVPTTPNTRIHKDHPIKNVIGDVKSTIQTRRMTKSTFEQGFLSVVYKQKTHDTLSTCLYACFLLHIEPTSIAKALSDSSWVEAMQEELLQFKLRK
ncbi:hypothetical protein Tco_0856115 [Tanacetum coccineum]